MKMFRKDEGFTLVELMVVVLIIGILVAIAIPVFNAAKTNAQRKSCWANQRTIDGACNSYQAEFDSFPADGDVDAGSDLIAEDYLKAVPTDPGSATDAVYSITNGETNGCPDMGHLAYQ